MSDMNQTIKAKSDQLNSDDLIGGSVTIRVTGVSVRGGSEQPVSISYEGDDGKPFKPCKTVCRVLVAIWGGDSKEYVGRRLTIYRDPNVKWAGMNVGGIRVSHASHIDKKVILPLAVSRSKKQPVVIEPLVIEYVDYAIVLRDIENSTSIENLQCVAPNAAKIDPQYTDNVRAAYSKKQDALKEAAASEVLPTLEEIKAKMVAAETMEQLNAATKLTGHIADDSDDKLKLKAVYLRKKDFLEGKSSVDNSAE